tara:strand:- start:2223 stop:2324 length:102 start_codon:yes stop_codon:yes gene_type:complete
MFELIEHALVYTLIMLIIIAIQGKPTTRKRHHE